MIVFCPRKIHCPAGYCGRYCCPRLYKQRFYVGSLFVSNSFRSRAGTVRKAGEKSGGRGPSPHRVPQPGPLPGGGRIRAGEYERGPPQRTFGVAGRQRKPRAECAGTSPNWSRPSPCRYSRPRGPAGQGHTKRLRPSASSTPSTPSAPSASSGQASSGHRPSAGSGLRPSAGSGLRPGKSGERLDSGLPFAVLLILRASVV